jgi:hypothetical protein
MAKRTVETGQRYRDVKPGRFGRFSTSDWIVEAVQTDALGIRHARLVSVADPSERKTLAAEVLVDPARFEQVKSRQLWLNESQRQGLSYSARVSTRNAVHRLSLPSLETVHQLLRQRARRRSSRVRQRRRAAGD